MNEPNCPECGEPSDVDMALTVLEYEVGPGVPYKDEVRYRLIAILAQLEGMIAPETDQEEEPVAGAETKEDSPKSPTN